LSVVWLHADEALVAIDKPAGMLSVPGRGDDKQDCASARVRERHADALVVHRLDMATSGILVFARGVEAQRRLSRAFAQREVHKRYVAVVAGRVPVADGEIDLPLSADWPNRPRQKVDLSGGKPSLTRYRVLAVAPDGSRTRLELEPVTGRSHQLRVHLLALGHPIVGDTLYAPQSPAGERLLLHASELLLPHPAGGPTLHLRSEPPF
jgi:tRNA pseudouridine32 synthase/23S rRNA pseudouridine746 synthase